MSDDKLVERVARTGAPASWRRYDELKAARKPIPNELCDIISVSISTARASLSERASMEGEIETLREALRWFDQHWQMLLGCIGHPECEATLNLRKSLNEQMVEVRALTSSKTGDE